MAGFAVTCWPRSMPAAFSRIGLAVNTAKAKACSDVAAERLNVCFFFTFIYVVYVLYVVYVFHGVAGFAFTCFMPSTPAPGTSVHRVLML